MDALGLLSDSIVLGLNTALIPSNLLYCFVGVLLGMLVGVLPGVGALAAVSMLFPLTFHLDAAAGLIMLAGIWYGTAYGGSTAAILLNIPGTPSSAVTSLDGYPMSKQGRAGIALFMTTLASFFGGSIGIVLIMLFSPIIIHYALQFGSQEYFALMLMGLVAASTISVDYPLKNLAMVVLGLIFGMVGIDIYSGANRFSFGADSLYDGINLAALAMGLFGVSEVIGSIRHVNSGNVSPASISFRSMVPTRDDMRRSWLPTLRGTGIGSFFGALPGTGPTIAAFMAYALEKKAARDPSRFGKGAIEGVVAPEAANNAADQTAFIPTLTLGIPGSATMAVMLGALMIQGIAPGPNLIVNQPELFWGLVMSFWIGNLILLVLNIPLIGIWVRLLLVPYHILYPIILAFICIGVFCINYSMIDVWMVLLFGAIGYVLRQTGYPAPALLLGFVLGPMMEEHLRRAMMISRGSFMTFFERPISATLMAITALMLLWTLRGAGKALFARSHARANSMK